MLRFILFIILCCSTGISFGQEDWTAQQKLDSVNLWVSEIEADSTVDTEIIGTGQFSAQFDRYDKLTMVATDSQFLDLTAHRSPAVRLYAYYGLTRNNPTLLMEALRAHSDDSAEVLCRNGAYDVQNRVYEAALTWAEEFLVRGNPRGLTREEKEYVHHEYIELMMSRREKIREEKKQKKSAE